MNVHTLDVLLLIYTFTGGADYVSVSSFLLTFPPGQTSLQYPVITTADGLLEDPEEFVVALTSTQASVVQRTASIVIVDATGNTIS